MPEYSTKEKITVTLVFGAIGFLVGLFLPAVIGAVVLAVIGAYFAQWLLSRPGSGGSDVGQCSAFMLFVIIFGIVGLVIGGIINVPLLIVTIFIAPCFSITAMILIQIGLD